MKRLLDLAVAIPGLIVFAPAIFALAVLIRLQSPGPGLLGQRRVGLHQGEFICYKLRTMYVGTAAVPTHLVGTAAITPVGGVLRRFKLDELPQLINVVRGDMSLVGPRPCLPTQLELIKVRASGGVFAVPPGITGLAQVLGIDMTDPVRLAAVDAEYVRTHSLLGDLRLMVRTLSGAGVGVDPARKKKQR